MNIKENKSNPYLSFSLGSELFAFPMSKVKTLLNSNLIIQLPFTHNFLLGKINFKEFSLPIVDLRKKLSILPSKESSGNAIIVIELQNNGKPLEIGVVVDFIKEIVEFDNDKIMLPPELGSLYKAGFISGIAKNLKRYFFLLNTDKIFTTRDLQLFKEIISTSELQLAV